MAGAGSEVHERPRMRTVWLGQFGGFVECFWELEMVGMDVSGWIAGSWMVFRQTSESFGVGVAGTDSIGSHLTNRFRKR